MRRVRRALAIVGVVAVRVLAAAFAVGEGSVAAFAVGIAASSADGGVGFAVGGGFAFGVGLAFVGKLGGSVASAAVVTLTVLATIALARQGLGTTLARRGLHRLP